MAEAAATAAPTAPDAPPLVAPAVAEGLQATREAFKMAMSRASELEAEPSPETEPFKMRYAGRAVLQEARNALAGRIGQLTGVKAAAGSAGGDDADASGGDDSEDEAEGTVADAEGAAERGTAAPVLDEAAAKEVQELRELLAHVECRLGVNFVVCEELRDGLDALYRGVRPLSAVLMRAAAHDATESAGDAPYSITREEALRRVTHGSAVLNAANHMCMVESSWEHPDKALDALRKATRAYELATAALRHLQADGGDDGAGGDGGDESGPGAAAARMAEVLAKEREQLELGYTHTCFYLAQVYGNLKKRDQAAIYCRATLVRQLPHAMREGVRGSELSDRVGWCKNALRLADFYTGLGQRDAASHCVNAASAMLKLEEAAQRAEIERTKTASAGGDAEVALPEGATKSTFSLGAAGATADGGDAAAGDVASVGAAGGETGGASGGASGGAGGAAEASAASAGGDAKPAKSSGLTELTEDVSVARADWHIFCGKAYLIAMGNARDREMARDMGKPWQDDEADAETAAPAPEIVPNPAPHWVHAERPFEALGFEEKPRIPTHKDIKGFEDAREFFKRAHAHYQQALSFYVLDGFVTNHVHILQDVSRAYNILAYFEPDPKRAVAMHQRRVALLADLLAVLNPNIYQVLHKELSLELGRCATDMVDLRIMRIEAAGRVKKSDIKTVCDHADAAIKFFSHFIRCYNSERVGEVPLGLGKMPEPLEGATELDEGSEVRTAKPRAVDLLPFCYVCVHSC